MRNGCPQMNRSQYHTETPMSVLDGEEGCDSGSWAENLRLEKLICSTMRGAGALTAPPAWGAGPSAGALACCFFWNTKIIRSVERAFTLCTLSAKHLSSSPFSTIKKTSSHTPTQTHLHDRDPIKGKCIKNLHILALHTAMEIRAGGRKLENKGSLPIVNKCEAFRGKTLV